MARIKALILTTAFPLFFICNDSQAQPYIDIAYIKSQLSPDVGLWKRNNTNNQIKNINAGLNIPIQFKKDSSILAYKVNDNLLFKIMLAYRVRFK